MEQDIRPMMPPWLESVELTIQHVRQEGEGMPVIDGDSAEGPLNSISGEAAGDPRILVNVIIVIVVDELMSQVRQIAPVVGRTVPLAESGVPLAPAE